MRRISFLLLLPLLLVSELSMAQALIVGPSPKTRTNLDLYDHPAAEQPVKQIPVGDAGFPLQATASQSGYHQVQIGGQTFWLKGASVQISRDTVASCAQIAKIERVGGTPGAGSNACK